MIYQQVLGETVKAKVQLRTGVSLSFLAQGDVSNEAMILLHGYSDSSFSFSRVWSLFSPRHYIFALDQRGHGDSSKDAASFTIQEMVDDVIAFMDAHAISKATVVGHSLGSMVAQKLAVQAPERVVRLVLVGAFIHGGIDAAVELHQVVQTLTDPVDLDFVREFQASTIFRSVPADFFDQVIVESARVPARVWQAIAADFVLQDTRPDLPRIQAPTLIMWGDQDAIIPWQDQQTLVQRIPNASLRVYAQTGHDPQWEVPEQFVADLEEFLRQNPI